MDSKELSTILLVGETVAVEFKCAGNGIENDTYETVCSFLNRFGGDIFLGIEDNGNVRGLPPKAVPDMIKNFVSTISNPVMLVPTVYLTPEVIMYEGKTIIHIHIPPSAEVHSFKKIIYDRVDDADVKVTSTSQIAAMYIRKQNIFTEKKIFPYLTIEHLRMDLMPRIRKMAVNNAGGKHPWLDMTDEEIFISARLYSEDISTGQKGFNLAAVMLLGKDNVILDACPAYRTDAILRKVNVDRYDDRLIVQTNLIESFDFLMEFAEKHLQDKFFLEGIERKSLRNIITREMIVNTLIHREMTSSYIAKFVIKKDAMYVENANRAARCGVLTPENFEPNPKNPIIASFFRNIGLSDQLGSGVRNLFKYSKYYSGKAPVLTEDDIFRIVVPLDDNYSFDARIADNDGNLMETVDKPLITVDKPLITVDKPLITIGKYNYNLLSENEKVVINYLKENGVIANRKVMELTGLSATSSRELLKKLVYMGLIAATGNNRNRQYYIL